MNSRPNVTSIKDLPYKYIYIHTNVLCNELYIYIYVVVWMWNVAHRFIFVNIQSPAWWRRFERRLYNSQKVESLAGGNSSRGDGLGILYLRPLFLFPLCFVTLDAYDWSTSWSCYIQWLSCQDEMYGLKLRAGRPSLPLIIY